MIWSALRDGTRVRRMVSARGRMGTRTESGGAGLKISLRNVCQGRWESLSQFIVVCIQSVDIFYPVALLQKRVALAAFPKY
jgi:hypothetical protein